MVMAHEIAHIAANRDPAAAIGVERCCCRPYSSWGRLLGQRPRLCSEGLILGPNALLVYSAFQPRGRSVRPTTTAARRGGQPGSMATRLVPPRSSRSFWRKPTSAGACGSRPQLLSSASAERQERIVEIAGPRRASRDWALGGRGDAAARPRSARPCVPDHRAGWSRPPCHPARWGLSKAL